MKKIMYSALFALFMCSACSMPKNEDKQQIQPAMNTQKNAVVETIMARRSIRKFKTQAVEKQKLDEIVKCGINAPNGMYKQSWEVRIVNTPEVMEEINKGYNAFLKAEGRTKSIHPSYGAPVLIFIANDATYDLSQVDCGLLGGNMILTAQSMNLGTCCLGGLVRYMNSKEAKLLLDRLQLPKDYQLLYAIALGYPAEQPAAKPRNFEKVQYVK